MFVQFFTIIIIKCKASFLCHSSSSHYSMQGFILILFHFIFSFLKNKILYNFTCDLLFSFWISELQNVDRHAEKKSQNLPSEWFLERKHFPFLSYLLALITRRNVDRRGHLRKGIVLLKYQYFRFRIKTGAHFELLNWL